MNTSKYIYNLLPKDIIDKVATLPIEYQALCLRILCKIHEICGTQICQISADDLKYEGTPNKYKELLKLLEFNGFLRKDGDGYVSKSLATIHGIKPSCKKYGLNSNFQNIESVELLKHRTSKPKNTIYTPNDDGKIKSECVGLAKVCLQKLNNFIIDENKALNHLEERQKGLVSGKLPLESNDYRVARDSILRISRGDYYTVMDRHNRIHTNITNLPRWIRKNCLKHKSNEPLVQLDIVASQPNILGMIMSKTLDTNNPIIAKELNLYIDFCKTDLYKCLYLIQKGTSWDDSDESKKLFKEELDTKLNRDLYKQEVVIMFFDENSIGIQENVEFFKLYKVFKVVFPNIYSEIKKMKLSQVEFKELSINKRRKIKKKLDKKGETIEDGSVINNSSQLAWNLQRYEGLILHALISKIKSLEIDFYTVHDAIIIQSKYLEEVKKTFTEILNNMGAIPNLEIEYL